MKTGVLLSNLGTPEALSEEAIRDFLASFLMDKNVIDWPESVWYPILEEKILPHRPGRKIENYRRIWTEEGSPLIIHTQNLTQKLGDRLGSNYEVIYGIAYGKENTESRIHHLLERGIHRLIVIPQYPQYSTTSTLSIEEDVHRVMGGLGTPIPYYFVESYYDHPLYIQAVVHNIHQTYSIEPFEALVASYHGIPTRYSWERQDPKYDQSHATSRLIKKNLEIDVPIFTGFQSKFGPEPWHIPSLLDQLEHLAKAGIKRLGVVAPSFTADCLETLDEIAIEGRDHFREHGGEELIYVPAVNSDDLYVECMEDIVRRVESECL